MGIAIDITERKHAEQALAHFAVIVASTDDAIITKNLDGMIISWNPAAERIFGYSAQEALGKSMTMLLPAGCADEESHILERIRRGEEVDHFETVRIRKDGKLINISATISPLKNDSGEIFGASKIARDITERKAAEEVLRKSQANLLEAQRMAKIGSWEWEVDSGVVRWSNEAYKIFGLTPDEYEPNFETYLDLIYPEDKPALLAALESALAGGGDYKIEHRIKLPDGTMKYLLGIGSVQSDPKGKPTFMRGVVQDITEKALAEIYQREHEAMIKSMSLASHDAMVMIDSDDAIIFWNSAAEKMFGYSRDEAIGQKMHALITHEEDMKKAYAGFSHFSRTGEGPVMNSVMEFVAIRRGGENFPVERSVAAFQMGGRWFAVGSLRDITERKQSEKRLQELATTDGLTQLANRRHFYEQSQVLLDIAIRYKQPLAIITFDVDHFKIINDTYGHDVGDKALKCLAELSRKSFRTVELVGRLGGEEFAVLMPETELKEAVLAAGRFRHAVEELRMPSEQGELHFTVSIGVSAIEYPDDTVESVIKRADTALYKAKGAGRNRVEAA